MGEGAGGVTVSFSGGGGRGWCDSEFLRWEGGGGVTVSFSGGGGRGWCDSEFLRWGRERVV